MAFDQTAINTFFTEATKSTDNPVAATGTVTFASVPTPSARASGVITFSGQPSANDTITLNGVVVTFVASGATGNQVNIGGSQAATVAALHTFLSGSSNVEIVKATWTTNGTSTVTGTFKVWGAAGNAYTFTKSSTNISVSGAGTFTGGSNGHTLTVNGTALTFIPASSTSPTVTDVALGADAATSAALLNTYLNASADANIDDATYSVSGAVVTVTHKVPGTGGNSFTLAKTGSALTLSGNNLSGGAVEGPGGRFQIVGTGAGEILTLRGDETFEDNVTAAIAIIDYILSTVDNPSTSNATNLKSRQQRKVLKNIVQAAASTIRPIVGTTDTRAADAAKVRKAMIAAFNAPDVPTTL